MFEFLHHPDCAPGTWWWTRGDKGPTASCPRCQALHMIAAPEFQIAPDGRVTPSLVCTRCGWHGEAVWLLGWKGSL